jgi:hypothetical protein
VVLRLAWKTRPRTGQMAEKLEEAASRHRAVRGHLWRHCAPAATVARVTPTTLGFVGDARMSTAPCVGNSLEPQVTASGN